MKPHYLYVIIFIIIFSLTVDLTAFSKDSAVEMSEPVKIIKLETHDETKFSKFIEFMKGKKAPDAVIGGMWSKHFASNNNYREVHNLGAIQHNGLFIGTFANSGSKQVFTVAAARELFRKEITEDFIIDVGYKIGPMYGYREKVPNIGRFSILPFACIGFSYKNVGVSLNIPPSEVISIYSYINLDKFKKP